MKLAKSGRLAIITLLKCRALAFEIAIWSNDLENDGQVSQARGIKLRLCQALTSIEEHAVRRESIASDSSDIIATIGSL